MRVLLPAGEQIEPAVERERSAVVDVLDEGEELVLVIDDEPDVRDTTRALLESAGLTVITACDGSQGVQLLSDRCSEVAAVLLDMSMPGMSGEATYVELRRVRGDVPVILYSGYTKEDALGRFASPGLAGYLQKPFLRADLIAKVRAAIGSQRPSALSVRSRGRRA